MVLGKTLASPLDSKELKPINPKGNPPSIFIGRADTEDPMLSLPPDGKSQLAGKDMMLGKIEGRRKRGQQMVGWHSQLNEHEFDQAPGDSRGHGSLVCYSPRGRRVGHNWVTEQQQPPTITEQNLVSEELLPSPS